MNEPQNSQSQDASRGIGDLPPGLVLPLVSLLAWPIIFWALRDPRLSPIPTAIVALFVVSMLWMAVSMLQVTKRTAKLGWRRSHFTRLIMGPRPTDPEESMVWQWALQTWYAIVVCVLCVIALTIVS
jgi:hypothetical protein